MRELFYPIGEPQHIERNIAFQILIKWCGVSEEKKRAELCLTGSSLKIECFIRTIYIEKMDTPQINRGPRTRALGIGSRSRCLEGPMRLPVFVGWRRQWLRQRMWYYFRDSPGALRWHTNRSPPKICQSPPLASTWRADVLRLDVTESMITSKGDLVLVIVESYWQKVEK